MDTAEEEGIPSTIELWVKYTFEERPYEEGWDPNKEYDLYDWEVNEQLEVEYIAEFFASPVEYLTAYTDEQIDKALWILINESEPDLYEFFNEELPLELRIRAVHNMYNVFEQLFFPRCTHITNAPKIESELSEINPLNSICFMWWDIIPMYGKSGKPNREVLDQPCIDVMEKTLQLDSIACQESALHGLGHWKLAYPERIVAIIDNFLESNENLAPDLRNYALAARTGRIL